MPPLCRQFFQRKFHDLEQQIFSQDRKLFAEEVFTEEQFTNMAVLLRSRIHPPLTENEVALVPLADKVSHSFQPPVLHPVVTHTDKAWQGLSA